MWREHRSRTYTIIHLSFCDLEAQRSLRNRDRQEDGDALVASHGPVVSLVNLGLHVPGFRRVLLRREWTLVLSWSQGAAGAA